MSLWKILLSLALGIVLSLGVAACGGGGGDDDDDDTANDDDAVNGCAACTADQVCQANVCVAKPDPCAACTADQTCENDVCVDKPTGPGDAVDSAQLVGKTFAFMCILDGTVSQPPGLGPVLKGLVQCEDIPPIALTILGVDGDTLTLVGGSLTADAKYDPETSVILAMPPADFTNNPLLEMSVDGEITIEIEGIELRIDNLEITGVVKSDFSEISNGTFGGGIDPTPLVDLLGSDPCLLIPGICDATTGFINLFVEDLLAVAVDTQIPAPPAQ